MAPAAENEEIVVPKGVLDKGLRRVTGDLFEFLDRRDVGQVQPFLGAAAAAADPVARLDSRAPLRRESLLEGAGSGRPVDARLRKRSLREPASEAEPPGRRRRVSCCLVHFHADPKGTHPENRFERRPLREFTICGRAPSLPAYSFGR